MKTSSAVSLGRTGILSVLFLLVLCLLPQPGYGQAFSLNTTATLPGMQSSSVAWGDYDNDNDLDFVLMGLDGTTASTHIYRNDGGVFQETGGLPDLSDGAAAWGDYDRDGDLDLLLTGEGTVSISRIYRNEGGTFSDINAGLPGLHGSAAAWADYDNDGDPDILLAGDNGSVKISRLYRNDGDGNFTDINAGLPGISEADVAWADYDRDGDPDILLAGEDNTGTGISHVYRNDGPGGFTSITTPLPGVSEAGVAWGDYDNDGDPDILLTGRNSGNPVSRIYHNYGTGFAEISTSLTNVSGGAVAWGDYDNDGNSDILLTGKNGGIYISRIYRNNGNGSFTDISAGLTNVSQGTVAWGDYEGDGDLDILLTGINSSTSTVSQLWKNNITTANTVPAAPTGLRVSGVTITRATLVWNAPADSQTPLAGLSYTVRIGTTSAGMDIQSPMASLTSGYRRVVAAGAGQATSAVTTGLLPGRTYYWSVQAIDGAYAGSAFSTTGSFTTPVFGRVATPALPAAWLSSVAWGDYDNDNDPDLLLTGLAGTSFISHVYRNDGGSFTNINAGLPGVSQGSVAWGDYDNDGDLDILLTGMNNASISISGIYRNNGGTFSDIHAGLPGVQTGSVVWVDYDRDGDLDIHLTGNGLNRIYRNTGGIFTDSDAGLPLAIFSAAAWSDYDRDGDPDLAITGMGSGGVLTGNIYRNDGGSFTNINAGLPGVSLGAVAWSDYDVDGDPDLLLTGFDGANYIGRVYRNDAGTFHNIQALLSETTTNEPVRSSAVWADYDNDGDPDILLAAGGVLTASCRIYQNNAGTFTEVNPGLPNLLQSSVAWGDYDGDSRLDFLITGTQLQEGPTTQLWENYGTTANTVPSVPTGLAVSGISATGATLSWNPAGDSQTPQVGLTYQLRIGTTSAGINIQSPMASLTTGYRRLVAPGAQQKTSVTIQGLSGGQTYYWSVQAVDGAYAGSAFSTSGSFTTPIFRELTTTLPGINVGAVVWGDYDRDGDPDILLAGMDNMSAHFSRVYRNDGNGNFTDINAGLPGLVFSSAAWGDYDRDGDLDFILAGDSSDQLISRIYRNDNGSFTNIHAGLPGIRLGSVAWSDYDNDGDLDILLVGENAGIAIGRIYRNDAGIFTDINAGLPGAAYGSAAWGDYDADGDPDIALQGVDNGAAISRVYRNDAGTFTNINAGLPGLYLGSLTWGDYDGDGDPDLLMGGFDNTSVRICRIYRNDAGVFTNINADLVQVAMTSGAWGDFDNDGDLDILLAGDMNGGTRFSRVYRNDGVAGFTDLQANIANLAYGSTAWCDYDGDGRLDILLAGENFTIRKTGIWKNHSLVANTPPAPPAGLTISTTGPASAILSWNRATDGQTPQMGLSYNVRIGTTNPGIDVQSPMASVATGYRYIPAVGGEQRNSTMITGLEVGRTYYWSVQAIDGAYAGSAFSGTGSFTMPVFIPSTVATLPGILGGAAAWGDYDADNDLDLLLTGQSGSVAASRIYRNHGGNFSEANAELKGVNSNGGAWNDYDNDGDLDILLAGSDGQQGFTALYRNTAGAFTEMNTALPMMRESTTDWADYDNDGDQDLLLTGSDHTFAAMSRIYRNNGNGSFSDINAGLIPVQISSAAWLDYDNDGDPDILLGGIYNNNTIISRLYRNDGAGVFSPVSTSLPGIYSGVVAPCDYDNDGDIDLALSGYNDSFMPFGRIYQNNGGGNFSDINAELPALIFSSMAWGDYDNDGDQDLLMAGTESFMPVSYVYRNTGGSFANLGISLPGISEAKVAWGDYDGDRDLDILLAGLNSNNTPIVQVYENHTTTANTPPAPPAGLSVSGIGLTSATLSWSPSTDSRTPQTSLSYNVRIGTSMNGVDVQSPMASVTTGYRRIPDTGNEGQTTATFITGLQPGTTYYWSVQTIDGAYAGSAFSTTGSFTTLSFAQHTTDLPAVVNSSVAWGDYDGDNDLDVLLTGIATTNMSTSRIYRNDGAGGFTSINAGLFGVSHGAGVWGDYDRDGDLDILLAGSDGVTRISRVYRNNGADSFSDINAGLPGIREAAVAWADYDNDGDLDILLAGSDGVTRISRMYRNNGADSFSDINAGLPGVHEAAVAWADYDNDGDPDILLTGEDNSATRISRIYRNDGGNFTDIEAGLAGVYSGSVAWSDYDADGDPDILLTGMNTDYLHISRMYRNDAGTFTDIGASLPGVAYSSVSWGDYEGDGDPDILMTGLDTNNQPLSRIYRNTGGHFSDLGAGLTGVYSGSGSWADYDNDHTLDILVTGLQQAFSLELWKNHTTTANTPPSAPTGLTVSVNSLTSVTLSWNRSHDSRTSQAALSYNVRIGTTSTGITVQSPMASVTSGYRRIVAAGTEQQTTSTVITGLSPGIVYYWSVQAIDASYAGSAFATAGSFQVNFAPHVSTTQTMLSMSEDIAQMLSVSVSVSDDYALSQLVVTATSSNQSLIADGGILQQGATAATTQLQITPVPNAHGSADITITVSDSEGLSSSTTFMVTVLPVNDPPVIGTTQTAIVIPEDISTMLTVSLLDIDTGYDMLTVTATSSHQTLITDAGIVQIGTTGALTGFMLTPVSNAYGTAQIIVRVSDGQYSATTVLTVTVLPVNDSPVISTLHTVVSTHEDTATTLTVMVDDADDAYNELTITATSSNQSLIPNTGILRTDAVSSMTSFMVMPAADAHGTTEVTIIVSDGEYSTTTIFTVTVLPVNDAPVLTTNAGLIVSEGSTAVIAGNALSSSDVDNTDVEITYSIISHTSSGTILKNGMALEGDLLTQADINAGIITYVHNGSETTSDEFSFLVWDGAGGSIGMMAFSITILPVNDRPVIGTSQTVLVVSEDTAGILTVTIADTDHAYSGLTLTVTSGNQNLIPDGYIPGPDALSATTSFMVIPVTNANGTTEVTVTVSDGEYSTTTIFTVIVLPVNDAPVLAVNTGLMVSEGSTATIMSTLLSSTDVDHTDSQLTYSLVSQTVNGMIIKNNSAPEGGTFTQADINAGAIAYRHNGGETTSDQFSFIVSDETGASISIMLFSITILSVNDSPVISTLHTVVSTHEDTATTLTVMVGDADDAYNELTITATSANQSLIPDTGILRTDAVSSMTSFTVIPAADAHGTTEVTVTVSDGEYSTTTIFTVTVLPVNDAPVLTTNAGLTVSEGSTAVIAGSALSSSDVDNTDIEITYSIISHTSSGTILKNGMALEGDLLTQADINAGIITYVHNGSETTSDEFSFLVWDGAGGSIGMMAFSITILPVNDRPVAVQDSSTACPGGAQRIMVLDNDIDVENNALTISSVTQGGKGSVTILPGNTSLRYDTPPGVSGQDSFTYTISDGNGGSSTATVSVSISFPLTVDAGDDTSLCLGGTVQISGEGTSDIGSMIFHWSPSDGLSNPDIANPVAGPMATTIYTLTITDGSGCSMSDQVTVTVLPAMSAGAEGGGLICAGSSVQLQATGGILYSWSPATGLDHPGIASPVAAPVETTIYTVTITNANGCMTTASVTVTVGNMPIAHAGSDVSICAGSSVQLQASGGVSYSWSPATGLDNPSIADPTARPQQTTVYVVTVVNAAGCRDTDTVVVTLQPAELKVSVLLEGPYSASGDSMVTLLHEQGLLPLNSPYAGGGSVVSIPAGTVDWVDVELRSDPNTIVMSRSGFLLKDGRIVDTDGSVMRLSNGEISGDRYYVTVRHRNHLAVMSSSAVQVSGDCALSYNFMSGAAQAYEQFSTAMKPLGGRYGMTGGDASSDGIINAIDRVSVWNTSQAGTGVGYYAADISLDGIVNAVDRVIVNNNNFAASQVP